MTRPKNENVLVLGGGLMGSQIALEYAAFGYAVRILTKTPSRTRTRLRAAARTATSAGLGPAAVMDDVAAAIAVRDQVASGEPTPTLIVESLPEDLDLKILVLTDLMTRFPEATVASNTSSFSIRALAGGLPDPARVLGTHYWNPPLLMALVELVTTAQVDIARVDSVRQTLRDMRKQPVDVGDDVGFVWNRLQFCLLREASSIVARGMASAEEIDTIVEQGLARRWTKNGPFATAQLGGVTTFTTIAAQILPELSGVERLDALASQTYLDDAALARRAEDRDSYLAAARVADLADNEPTGRPT